MNLTAWVLSIALFIAMWAGLVLLAQMFTAAMSVNALQDEQDAIDDFDGDDTPVWP